MSRFTNQDGFVPNGGDTPQTEEHTSMMPLMTGGDDAKGDWSNPGDGGDNWGGGEQGEGGNKMLSHGTLLIIGIVLIAAGSLYAMRMTGGGLSTDDATKAVEAKIESFLAKVSNPAAMDPDDPRLRENIDNMSQDTEEIIAVFNNTVVDRQVPVEYIAKNPFALRLTSSASTADASTIDRDTAIRLEKLKDQVGKLELQTVMGSARAPVAVISGEFYRQNDKVGDFTLTTISPDTQSVTLTAEGHQFELTMID